MAFVPIEPINVRTKFEVCSCSFTHSWDNRGTQKMGTPWLVVTHTFPSDGPYALNVLAKFEIRSFTRSW